MPNKPKNNPSNFILLHEGRPISIPVMRSMEQLTSEFRQKLFPALERLKEERPEPDFETGLCLTWYTKAHDPITPKEIKESAERMKKLRTQVESAFEGADIKMPMGDPNKEVDLQPFYPHRNEFLHRMRERPGGVEARKPYILAPAFAPAMTEEEREQERSPIPFPPSLKKNPMTLLPENGVILRPGDLIEPNLISNQQITGLMDYLTLNGKRS